MVRIAEEVAITKKPRELRRDEKTVAILVSPTSKAKPKKHRAKTKADYEAFKSAAGSWSGRPPLTGEGA